MMHLPIAGIVSGGLSIYDLMDQGVVYIAHRGMGLRSPEHTQAAFDASVEAGYNVIEPDVQLLSDGGLAVIHDTTIDAVTTETGNVVDKSTATFEGLTIDAGTWFGGGFGNLSPLIFPDFLTRYKGRTVMFPEAKYPSGGNTTGLGNAVVAALQSAGVPPNQCVVTCFDLTPLGPVVSAGYPAAIAEFSGGSEDIAAAQSAGASFAVLSQDLSDARFGEWLAAGFYVFAYTIDRRIDRDRVINLGVHGMYTDDQEYIEADAPFSTTDNFSAQTWQPGMLAYNHSSGATISALAEEARGRFSSPDYWGYADSGISHYRGCLQGWACPVASDPENNEWLLDFKVTFGTVSNADQTRWASVAIAETDEAHTDGAIDGGYTTGPNVYHFLMRKNGTLQIYKRDTALVGTLLAESTAGTAISNDEQVRFQIEINETKLQLRRLDGGGSTVQKVTSYDVTPGHRGGYFHLGHSRMPAHFRDISIGSSTPYDLWTPAQLPAGLWFSASDSEYTGGTWRDISGNTRHFTQGTGGNQPTYSATGLNSLPALDFDGGDYLDAPAGALGLFNSVSQAWFLAVYRHDVSDGSNIERPIAFFSVGTGAVTRAGLFAGGPVSGTANRPYFGGRRLDADSFGGTDAAAASVLAAGEECILLGIMDFSARTATLYKNGEIHTTGSSLWGGSGNTSATDSQRARLGANAGSTPTRFLNGRVRTAVFGNTPLTTDLINKLNGWAHHESGLASLLDSGHPYKSAAPTV